MKIVLSRKIGKLAAALFTTLVLLSIISLFLMYYLSLAEHQTRMNSRSQAWNMAIAVAEAGVEDALQHLNSNYPDLAKDGWVYVGSWVFCRSNTLPNGDRYWVSLNISNSYQPGIVSKGYVTPPALAQGPLSTVFAAVGASVASEIRPIARAVRVSCSRGKLFSSALVVKDGITLNGNGVLTDSYNSTDPAKSTNHRYDPYRYAGDQGDVATNAGISNTDPNGVKIGNANIYGHLHTGPNCHVGYGPMGAVGSHAWQASNVGEQPSWRVQDANFTFPDTTPPADANTWISSLPGDIVVTDFVITANPTNSTIFPIPYPWKGVISNVVNTTTVSDYPSTPTPGLTTNTYMMTSPVYPSPAPAAGVKTNTLMATSSTYPNPAPAAGVQTNVTYNTSTVMLSPVPSGTTTNTHDVKDWAYNLPAPGVVGGYVPGSVTQTGMKYNFTMIDSFTYPRYSFTYPTYTYTYPTYTYTYPNYSYTWNLYQTNSVQVTNHYDHVFYSNTKYKETSLSGSSIVLGPNVSVYLPNGLAGTENIRIEDSASLLVYAGGTSVGVTGSNIYNRNGYAGSFIVYCAPSVTSFTLSGNGEFTGVLVAPNADLVLNGGGGVRQDFCGSIMAKSANMNGLFSFHYDEALAQRDGTGRYLILGWNEISPN